MKKFYVIAGEASGDLHGAHLVKALKKQFPNAIFRGFGGEKMKNEGVYLDLEIDKLSFMGFAEVIANLRTIFKNIALAKECITQFNPSAIIYVDFPGFNMRIANWAKRLGFKNYYYIAPQAWAWKSNRAYKIQKDVDKLFCILPFEKEFFEKYGCNVHYVGHPLVDIIQDFKNSIISDSIFSNGQKVIALLPGSRQQEVRKILPVQLEAANKFSSHEIVIAKSSHLPLSLYNDMTHKYGSRVRIIEGKTYEILKRADMACVASGTATLETALFKVPEVICYKGNLISYHIAKRLVKVPFIGLANLIMNKKIIEELIQDELTSKNLYKELKKFEEKKYLKDLLVEYNHLEKKLGLGGAAERTASIINQDLE